MRLRVRAVSASTMALALRSPLAAGTADPAHAKVQYAPPRPGIETGPESVSPRPGSNNPSTGPTLQESPVPISLPPRIGLFPEFGQTLLARGIDLHGVAFDHFLANTTVGVEGEHTTGLAAFRPAVDSDLERLTGDTIRTSATFFGLRSDIPQIAGQIGGVLVGFQTTPVVSTNILSLLTYKQQLLNNRLSIEVRRTNVYDYFFLSNSLDSFQQFPSTV